MTNTHCVQCGREMTRVIKDPIDILIGAVGINPPFCANPSCPNFALLQTPELQEVKETK